MELVVVVIWVVVAVAATEVARVMAGFITAWLGDGGVTLLLVCWHRTQKQTTDDRVYVYNSQR